MKKNFDLHRLGMVLRWDISHQLERHLGSYIAGTRHLHFHLL